MPMSLTVMQVFESLRVLRDRALNKTSALVKGQSDSAPLVPTVQMLEDLHNRVSVLEEEQGKRGVMVPDPSQDLIGFVSQSVEDATFRAMDAGTSGAAIKALFGRVLHEVRKIKTEHEGELRAAMHQKKDEWRHQSVGGVQALTKLEERLVAMLTGKSP